MVSNHATTKDERSLTVQQTASKQRIQQLELVYFCNKQVQVPMTHTTLHCLMDKKCK